VEPPVKSTSNLRQGFPKIGPVSLTEVGALRGKLGLPEEAFRLERITA